MESTRASFLSHVARVGEKMVAYVGASADQEAAFARRFTAAMEARLAEIMAGATLESGHA